MFSMALDHRQYINAPDDVILTPTLSAEAAGKEGQESMVVEHRYIHGFTAARKDYHFVELTTGTVKLLYYFK